MVRMPRPDMVWTDSIPYIIWYLFVLILLTNVICYTLYGRLLKTYSATFMALASATVPIFTAIFDWLLFGLTVTWHFVATVVIVFIGLAIFYADEIKKIGIYIYKDWSQAIFLSIYLLR
jgi:drug/metabolite transporter (DMT)-like permease